MEIFQLFKGLCYFFGVVFFLGGLFLLITYSVILGFGGMIIGIILIAIGHRAGSGYTSGKGHGGSSGGGGKSWWELTDEQKKRAQQASWYNNYGPGKRR